MLKWSKVVVKAYIDGNDYMLFFFIFYSSKNPEKSITASKKY